jgi:hypothetical protein
MLKIKTIIIKENELTDRAKFDLGDNYMLSIDLLSFIQEINSFNQGYDIALNFHIQIISDLHLAILNSIRRHTIVTNILIRHTLESLVLFVYSLENKEENKFISEKNENEIIDFEEKQLIKANKFIEENFPAYSHRIEIHKNIINIYFSHSNIYSSSFNKKIFENRISGLIFDYYFDGYIHQNLCEINNVICLILRIYNDLNMKYNFLNLNSEFKNKLTDLLKRHDKNVKDITEKYNTRKKFPPIDRMIEKLEKKYGGPITPFNDL